MVEEMMTPVESSLKNSSSTIIISFSASSDRCARVSSSIIDEVDPFCIVLRSIVRAVQFRLMWLSNFGRPNDINQVLPISKVLMFSL